MSVEQMQVDIRPELPEEIAEAVAHRTEALEVADRAVEEAGAASRNAVKV